MDYLVQNEPVSPSGRLVYLLRFTSGQRGCCSFPVFYTISTGRLLTPGCIDGVAPRAKMNQQRSRRFRAAQEDKEKDDDKEEFVKMLKSQNNGVLSEGAASIMNKKTWDRNAITPGTPFMDILAACLRYWTAYKLNTDPAWEKVGMFCSS